MGRIIDLRDPDDYIPFDVYQSCVERAEKATNELVSRLEKEFNEKLSVLNKKILLKKWKSTNWRTYVDIFCIINGEEKFLHRSALSDGDDLEKDVRKCCKQIVCEYFGF